MTATLTPQAGEPEEVVYEPHGACRTLFTCRDTAVCIVGPAGTGKSVAALWRAHAACLKVPGVKVLLVRKTAVSLAASTAQTYQLEVAAAAIAVGEVEFYGGSPQEPASYRYRNGSRIVLGGMDKPGKVMSTAYDVIIVDEANEITEADLEYLLTRLRNRVLAWQQIILATNPDGPKHWIRQRADRGQLTVLESRHEDNPTIYQDGQLTEWGAEYLNDILGGLTGVRRLRLLKGLWAAAEGLIYEEWDPAVHLIDRFEIPDDWPRWWSVDFGYVHPFVLQWWAEDPDGRLIMYRELYRSRRLVEDHARDALLAVTAPVDDRPVELATADQVRGEIHAGRRVWTEPRPRSIWADHAASDRATFERHLGMSTTPAKKDVVPGIQAVQSRLRGVDGRGPRLLVMRDAVVELDRELAFAKRPTSTVGEITDYVWLQPRAGQEAKAKEEPRKEHDDGMDALRYVVAGRDLKGRPMIRGFDGSLRSRR